MTGASPPCFSSARDVDLLELLEHLDVVVGDVGVEFLERRGDHLEGRGVIEVRRLRPARRLLLRLRGARAAPLRVVPRDRVGDRGFGRDDRLDVVARHELDVVHGEDVGRVGHRDRQRRAGAAERHDLVLPARSRRESA